MSNTNLVFQGELHRGIFSSLDFNLLSADEWDPVFMENTQGFTSVKTETDVSLFKCSRAAAL